VLTFGATRPGVLGAGSLDVEGAGSLDVGAFVMGAGISLGDDTDGARSFDGGFNPVTEPDAGLPPLLDILPRELIEPLPPDESEVTELASSSFDEEIAANCDCKRDTTSKFDLNLGAGRPVLLVVEVTVAVAVTVWVVVTGTGDFNFDELGDTNLLILCRGASLETEADTDVGGVSFVTEGDFRPEPVGDFESVGLMAGEAGALILPEGITIIWGVG